MSLIRAQKVLLLQLSQLHHRRHGGTADIEKTALYLVEIGYLGIQLIHRWYHGVVLQLGTCHLMKPLEMAVAK